MRSFWNFLKNIGEDWSKDRVLELGAALAFYSMLSLAPLLVVIVTLVGFFFGERAVEGQLVEQIEDIIGAEGAELAEVLIANAALTLEAGWFASLISVGILLFAATGAFIQLHVALNRIVKVENQESVVKSFFRRRLVSFLIVLGLGLVLVLWIVGSALTRVARNMVGDIIPDVLFVLIDYGLSFGLLTLVFAMIFKFVPDARMAWKDVLIGAAFTAILFILGRYLIGLYMAHNAAASVYGAAGSVVIVLLWIFYSSQILFIGAEFTQVYARKFGSGLMSNGKSEEAA